MWFLPFIAVVCEATMVLYHRWLLVARRIPVATSLFLGFFFVFVMMAVLFPFFGEVNIDRFGLGTVSLILFTVVVGVVANFYDSSGVKKTQLRDYDLSVVLTPILAIVFAAILFPDEREPIKLGLAVLASGSFLLTHIKRHHLSFSRGDQFVLISALLFALEAQAIKPILSVINPVAYYGLRGGLISLAIFVGFKPKLVDLEISNVGHYLVFSVIAAIRALAVLYSISVLGIVFTQLVLLLQPILVAMVSSLHYGERWNFRQLVGLTTVVGCLVVLTIIS